MTDPDPGAGSEQELLCPRCGLAHPTSERLCRDCRMPLVVAGSPELDSLGPGHEEARKIDPRYARGELQRVAVGRNLSEGELIKGVLLEQGIPSMLRRTAGFDVPDFLAAGPRDVLVPESGAGTARELLAELDEAETEALGTAAGDPGRDGGEEEGTIAFGPSPMLKFGAAVLAALLVFSALAGIVYVLAG